MTDSSQNQEPEKPGMGKSLASGATTFGAVLIALTLQEHYADMFEHLKDVGYPLSFIISVISGVISHLITWWTSQNLMQNIICWIHNWKRIVKEWNSPP